MISRRVIAAVLQRSNVIFTQTRAIAAQNATGIKDSGNKSGEAWNKTNDAVEDAAQKIKESGKQKWEELNDDSKGKSASEIKDAAKQKLGEFKDDVQSATSNKDKYSDRYQTAPWNTSGSSAASGSSCGSGSDNRSGSSGSDNRGQQRFGFDKCDESSKLNQWQTESVEGDRKWQGKSQSQGRAYSEKDSTESGRAYSNKSHRPTPQSDETRYGSGDSEERGSGQRSGPSSWGRQEDRSWRNDQSSDWGYSRGPQGYDQGRRRNNPNQSWGGESSGTSGQYKPSQNWGSRSSGPPSPYYPSERSGALDNSLYSPYQTADSGQYAPGSGSMWQGGQQRTDFGQYEPYRQRQSSGFPNYGQSVGQAGENWGSAQAGYGQGWESKQFQGQGQNWTNATGVPQYGYSHGRPSQKYENDPRNKSSYYGQGSSSGSQNWNSSQNQPQQTWGSQGRSDNFSGQPGERWPQPGDYQYGSSSAPENWYRDGAASHYSEGQGRYNDLAHKPWEPRSSNLYTPYYEGQSEQRSGQRQVRNIYSESGPVQSRYGTSSPLQQSERSGQSGYARSSENYGDQNPSEYQKQQESLPPVGGFSDGQYFGSGSSGSNFYGGSDTRKSRDDLQGNAGQRGRPDQSDWKGDWNRKESKSMSDNSDRDHDSLSGKIKDKVEDVVEKVEGMASSAWEKLGGASKEEKDRK